MGGSSIEDNWDFNSPSNGVRSVVLVGRTGNGKSATGNSILGKKAFKSKTSPNGVTSTCELQTVTRADQVINVIDTPGLFDFSAESEFVGKEIMKYIDLAKDGIHAVLVVLSVTNRFSKEEASALLRLQTLFGTKIIDYMIVVFTGGDALEEDEETLEDYLGRDCPKPLKDILDLCQNRRVLFDNKSRDESKRAKQVGELLSLVNMVIQQNGGQAYTNEWLAELKKEHMPKSYDDLVKLITETVELKFKETITRLEQLLAEERAARLQAEETAQLAQEKSNDEMCELRANLERAQRETEELRNRCAIL